MLRFTLDQETLQIEAWGPDSFRVRSTMHPAIAEDATGTGEGSALLPPEPVIPEIVIGPEGATITNGRLRAEVRADGELRFSHAGTGAELLAEPERRFMYPSARYFKAAGGDLFTLEARFKAYPDEHLYGLGQHPNGRLDQKGCVVDLVQRNSEVCIPFVLSSRGYGFLWNNPGVGRAELGYNGTRWIADGTHQLDYWITVGDTPAEIMAHYADATGHAPLLPEWAAGFWQCKLRYATQEELLSVAREYRQRGLPLSIIVVDYFHWTLQGDWQFDPACWPDPAAMVRELEELGVKVMVSIWPTVNPASANFAPMRQRGLLLRAERGVNAQMMFVDTGSDAPAYMTYYDATNPEARRFIWERVRQGYYRHGIKVWWLDACEPECYPTHPENLRFHLGSGLAAFNLYPLLHERGFYEGMRSEGETEIITLCRSAWASSQRYAAAVWSGDIDSTFESLAKQVRAGLNIGLSGIPWWTTDIGGFSGGDVNSPYFRELIVRWFQYGVFCPLFRLHGNRAPGQVKSGGPNEVWSFGEEAYGIIRELMFLRERLRPYLMAQMEAAHRHGAPPMRPLFYDFPADARAWEVEDQFMCGPDLLVAPVVTEGARERAVYLPAGAQWTDAWTGVVLPGGQTIVAAAPLERIPLYLRDGSALPIKA